MTQQRKGELFLVATALLEGLSPVIIHAGSSKYPPLLFAGICTLLSSIFYYLWVLKNHNFGELLTHKALPYLLGVTLFVVIIPSALFYTGSSMTSGINTAILMQMEIFFMLFMYGFFLRDHTLTFAKIISALLIAFGAMTIVFPGKLSLNMGDGLIILGTVFPPIGNYFAKKAVKLVDSSVILFTRSFIGGVSLLFLSAVFERNYGNPQLILVHALPLILAQTVLVLIMSKICWYEGLKRTDVPKAMSISNMYPAFSLVYAMVLLGEIPTSSQLTGFVIMMIGILGFTRKDLLGSLRWGNGHSR